MIDMQSIYWELNNILNVLQDRVVSLLEQTAINTTKLVELAEEKNIEYLRPSVLYKAELTCLPVRVETAHVTYAMVVEFDRWGELFEDLPAYRPLWVADIRGSLHGYGASPEEALRDFDKKWLGRVA